MNGDGRDALDWADVVLARKEDTEMAWERDPEDKNFFDRSGEEWQ